MILPTFSICHTTGRPAGWQHSATAWLHNCDNWEWIEYILCADQRWGFEDLPPRPPKVPPVMWKTVWNTGRKCMVDGYNAALALARGHILILNSDDMFPPAHWDTSLLEAVSAARGKINADEDFVIQVSSGTPADARDLMVLQILSRSRYKRLGYALYPQYEGVFSDDDFSEHARQDGVVIDARGLLFKHEHPTVNGGQFDEVYAWQNRSEQYEVGASILARRRQVKFRT
jgi:hypothetical protein